MEKNEFEKLLIEAQLSKKEFAKKVKMNPNSITNWNSSGKIPDWVESWLDMYIRLNRDKNYTNNDDIEDFVLNTALNKIVEAFQTKKVNDNYILIAIASAIENSQDKYEIGQKIITYLAEDYQEARRARGVFIMISEIETEILIKNKNKVIKKLEEYIRTMDNLSSLYQFDYFLDIDSSIKTD